MMMISLSQRNSFDYLAVEWFHAYWVRGVSY